jgi:hypothetical protein
MKITIISALGLLTLLTISCDKGKEASKENETPAATVSRSDPQPKSTEPEATEPEATEPKATEPEATEPETTEPEASSPSKNLALGKKINVSSTHHSDFPAENAVDGKPNTYWSSEFKNDQWLAVDLGEPTKISGVKLVWENAYAKAFSIETSTDGDSWTEVYDTAEGKGGTDEIKFPTTEAQHIRLNCGARATEWGNAVIELEVFE